MVQSPVDPPAPEGAGGHDGIQPPIFGEIFVDIFCFFSFKLLLRIEVF